MRKVWTAAAVVAAIAFPGCGGGGGGGTNAPTVVAPTPQPAVTPVPVPAPTPTANMSGTWDSEARRWHFRLEQRGNTLTGVLLGFRDVYYGNPDDQSELQIRGAVTGAGVSFGCPAWGLTFDGVIESGSQVRGTLFDCGNGCRSYGDLLVRTGR